MKISLIVLGALAASFLLRRRSAALRHWVLAAGVACAAAVPILTSVVPAWPLPFAAPTSFVPYHDPFTVTALQPRPALPAIAAPGVASGPPVSRRGLDLTSVVMWIWLTGMAVGVSVLLTGLIRLGWLASGARRVTRGRWHDLAQELSRSYGLRRAITVLQSDHPSLLVTWGLVHPKVILPASAVTWTDARARVVLSHELAHIRRGDWIVQLAAELLRAIYWFNPLLWVACRRLRLESEHACDDEVIRRGVAGTDYASHLIALARSLPARPHMWLPAPAMARPSSFERRIRAMLNVQCNRSPLSRGARAGIFLLLFGAAAVVSAAQGGFVTFSGQIADEQSRGVPAVTVVLVNEARQAKYEVKTSPAGRFEFVGLPAGDYALEATGSGFQSLKDQVLVSGQNFERNYTLRLGTLQETINVTDDGLEHRVPAVRERPAPPRAECAASGAGGRIRPPRKIRDVSPIYPASLRGTGTGGVVLLRARIALDGYLTDISVEGEAQPDMASAAVAAVREWQYTETLLNCQPVDVVMNITITFKGMPPPPPPAPPRPR
jgi:beta-lactamase regulating signal transducer with metallopeptidase domain